MVQLKFERLITKLLETFREFMYNRNEKKKSNDRGNKICWVAATLVGRSERGNKQNFDLGLSSRTVALWFYILIFDHNATDPVVQKEVQFTAQIFLCTLGMYFSTFHHCSSIYLLFPISRHILINP
jgi:hypothetical protein